MLRPALVALWALREYRRSPAAASAVAGQRCVHSASSLTLSKIRRSARERALKKRLSLAAYPNPHASPLARALTVTAGRWAHATAPANWEWRAARPDAPPAGPEGQPVANRRGGGGDSVWRTIALQGGGSYGASPTGWRRYARRGPPGVPREGVSTRIGAAAAKIRCGEQ